ncbi:MAG: haloacid dehalogenase type II [Gammaproteobacteria bacterium]|jgi:2-haloacid dehalogenase|nr:haloacid dehalogenase type II [Gammaproteobacteria bacterium]MCP4881504.1 haloacid dehalogenase type II [Gammaproteobacteria bacterium]MDP6165604.1 haloacid dehalogenase type II [Gammaproteobacteria bacterium]
MSKVLAFDVYGTLIDPHGVVSLLQSLVGDQAVAFSTLWRNKQLEYTFRRAAMGGGKHYRDFGVCTQAALDYTDAFMQTGLSEANKQILMTKYAELPAFEEVPSSLQALQASGLDCWAFSNGTPTGVAQVISHAGIEQYLLGVFSVNQVRTFKPAGTTYDAFAKQHAHGRGADCVLISSNPFDVIGAKAAGWHAVWLQRSAANVFDPWELQPDVTIASLEQLLDVIVSLP